MNWYSRYPGDYRQATSALSLVEHGAYTLLLDHCYSTEEPLPGEPAKWYRICGAITPDEQEAVRSVVAEFFEKREDGKCHNPRVAKEMAKRDAISGKRREAGKAGAAARWDGDESNEHESGANDGKRDGKRDGKSHGNEMAKTLIATTTSTSTPTNPPPHSGARAREASANRPPPQPTDEDRPGEQGPPDPTPEQKAAARQALAILQTTRSWGKRQQGTVVLIGLEQAAADNPDLLDLLNWYSAHEGETRIPSLANWTHLAGGADCKLASLRTARRIWEEAHKPPRRVHV